MPLPQPPLAPELLGLVQHVAAYERLAASAAASGDRDAARRALLAHPLVREYRLADSMLERLLAERTGGPWTRTGSIR
jgi:6-phospho-beta-glucosidase